MGAGKRTAARHVGALIAFVALICALTAGPATASAGKPHSPGIPGGARAKLLAAAVAMATTNGDSHPRDIEAIRTSRPEAERIACGECRVRAGPGAPATPVVYVVAMRGHFSCHSCLFGPRGSTPPGPATVITLRFLASDLQHWFGFDYGGRSPDLRAAGTPVRL